MKRSAILIPLVISAMLGCNNATTNEAANTKKTDSPAVAAAPAKDTTTPPPAMDSAAMMKRMMDYMTPGDMQKMLASSDGTWSGDVTMWMDPSKPPSLSKGTRVNKMILGGRYQQSTITNMMDNMPFEATSITGYDNAKKMFFNTWMDNMGTGILYTEGPWDAASKTITLKGKMMDPSVGKEIEIRMTLKMIDDRNQLSEMYTIGKDGKETKTLEIKYTKK